MLWSHRHWRASVHVLEEFLRHESRHPNAAMRRWISRQEAFVQSHGSMDPHKEWHASAVELRPFRHRILFAIDILLDNGARVRIDVIAVQRRQMIFVLLNDLK